MADGISLLDIPQAAPAELAAGQFMYVVTPDGQPYKADISELVAKMQADAGAQIVKIYSQDVSSAELLSGNTTPIALNIPRASGVSIYPINFGVGLTFVSAAYATNTVIAARFVGADVPVYTCDILARTTSGFQFGQSIVTVGAAQSQVLTNTDMEVFVDTGNPTAGDGSARVSVLYIEL